MKTSKNVGFKSSMWTQKKRNLQAKIEELDIARRNAARNSPEETLLQEKEEEKEERKRFRYPIGLESSQESSPSGQPLHPQTTRTPNISFKNPPIETISDDDASDLIFNILFFLELSRGIFMYCWCIFVRFSWTYANTFLGSDIRYIVFLNFHVSHICDEINIS